MIPVAVFAEGYFEKDRSKTFKTKAEAKAFHDGMSTGAGLYGAGCYGAYAIPDDEADMREREKEPEIEQAMIWAADKIDRALQAEQHD